MIADVDTDPLARLEKLITKPDLSIGIDRGDGK